jgi:hypothetical protein
MLLGEAWEAVAAASIVISLSIFYSSRQRGMWGKWGEVGCVGEAGKLSTQLKISTYIGISASRSGRKNCLNPKYPSVLKITARAL